MNGLELCPRSEKDCSPAVAVKERPVIFNGNMVRAILDGRKTQTRRIVKPTPDDWIDRLHGNDLRGRAPYDMEHYETGATIGYGFQSEDTDYFCRYGRPGERLWVRESVNAWRGDNHAMAVRYSADDEVRPFYDRDDEWEKLAGYAGGEGRTVPSIHMPRWASRITLEIENVRLQRLTEVSDADATAEGYDVNNDDGLDPLEWFAKLWESINGAGSWHENPWVWVVDFRAV